MTRRGIERGQASVELALVLPAVAVVFLVALQLLTVVRDRTAVELATRAAARAAMVDPDSQAVRDAALSQTSLVADRLSIQVSGDTSPGGYVTVSVRYRAPTDVPVVGRFVGDVDLTERLVALRE